ncbi:unnamed protein product [Hymenolepis diminuta]|uniref:Uncharacterized protein n=1 Tax=Hymenolepis diminuta TaxID=6216 RepID=A0A0R3SVX8_HYMDI|nr:unnamed protein product [Hymenolepis diminuta]
METKDIDREGRGLEHPLRIRQDHNLDYSQCQPRILCAFWVGPITRRQRVKYLRGIVITQTLLEHHTDQSENGIALNVPIDMHTCIFSHTAGNTSALLKDEAYTQKQCQPMPSGSGDPDISAATLKEARSCPSNASKGCEVV